MKNKVINYNSLFLAFTVREYSNPACQILQKYSDRLSQVAVPFELLYTEGVITRETSKEIEILGGYLINGPLRSLHKGVYKDHYVLKRFASILLKSEDTISSAQDILNDYSRFNVYHNYQSIFYNLLDRTFPSQAKATPLPSSLTTTSGNNVCTGL